jgi:hypothetical protein
VQFNQFNWRLWGWLGALFLVGLGAKLWVIQLYGTAVPYWDQWDEAKNLFKPWLEGQWTWGMWFGPHNEHRIFFTRALDVIVLWLNGQWDPLLQMVVNACLHTGYACGLAYGLWVFTGRKYAGEICFLLMPFFALPFAAENTLHGFQSQMYFLGIFSVLTIVGLGFGRPWAKWWWCGWVAAGLSLFTMGSGMLAALAVLGLMGLRALKQKGITRDQTITAMGCLVVFLVGLGLDVALGKHGLHRTKPVGTFVEALLSDLAWPFINQPAMLLVVGLPLAIIAVKYFQSGFKDPRAAELVLALGLWGGLQAAALAYARAHLGSSSRYMDTLSIIALASQVGLLLLGEPAQYRRLSRPLLGLLAVVWTGWLFWGMWQLSWATMGGTQVEHYVEFSRRTGRTQEQNVRAFMATGDPVYLVNKPLWDIPYSDAGELMTLLHDPVLQKIMPPVCRPPLKLEWDGQSDNLLVLNMDPPGVPKREWKPVWSNGSNDVALTGHFVSQPLQAALPRLSLELFCGPIREGGRYSLVEPKAAVQLAEQDGGRRTELVPQPSGRWQTFIVSSPRGLFRLEITSHNPDVRVAIGELEEWGRLSTCARSLLDRAAAVLLAGLGLGVLLAGAAVFRHRVLRSGPVSFQSIMELLILLALLAALAWVWAALSA